jgi:hypothetical protein
MLDAGHFLVQTLQVNSDDPYGMAQHLAYQAISVVKDLETFKKNFDGHIPAPALAAIGAFLATHSQKIENTQVAGLGGLKVRKEYPNAPSYICNSRS